MKIDYIHLTPDMQIIALEKARHERNIIINLEDGVMTELPEFITIKYNCSDCEKEYKIKYKNVDWIYLVDIQGFNCPEEDCEGKCYQVW